MNDMAGTIIPKSDQLNADDLITGPITIRITSVTVRDGGEQPVSIHYEGDKGKPYKPGKSMCRVMVAYWGPDSKQYAGRAMTLFRDPEVKFGGIMVGGIRISHMSHITADMTIPLTVTRGKKKEFTVHPLIITESPEVRDLKRGGHLVAKKGTEALKEWWKNLGAQKQQLLGSAFLDEMKAIAAGIDRPADVGHAAEVK